MQDKMEEIGRPRENHNDTGKHWFREAIELLLFALLIVAPIRLFVVNPFIVSGSSMVPTFYNGEYLIVDQITYRFDKPERGDVVIFRYPKDPSKFFIKRIVGLPNETVEIKNGIITIKESGPKPLALDEPYVKNKSRDNSINPLADNQYFVLGDNRMSSSDSRVWGTLDGDLIVGRALLRLLPVTEAVVFPGRHNDYVGQN